jgi:hypothetical protein
VTCIYWLWPKSQTQGLHGNIAGRHPITSHRAGRGPDTSRHHPPTLLQGVSVCVVASSPRLTKSWLVRGGSPQRFCYSSSRSTLSISPAGHFLDAALSSVRLPCGANERRRGVGVWRFLPIVVSRPPSRTQHSNLSTSSCPDQKPKRRDRWRTNTLSIVASPSAVKLHACPHAVPSGHESLRSAFQPQRSLFPRFAPGLVPSAGLKLISDHRPLQLVFFLRHLYQHHPACQTA